MQHAALEIPGAASFAYADGEMDKGSDAVVR